jgi:membrane protein DedA with SNARE-associated domain
MTIEAFISTYGYAAVAVGTFLEGETTLFVAGFAAQRGYLELPWVIAAAFAGTLAADQFYFYLGRLGGARLLERRPAWQRKAGTVLRLLERHQTFVILSFRFIYGVRTLAPFVIGLSGVSRLKYLGLTCVSTSVWATTMASVGYLFGHALDRIRAEFERYGLWVLVGLGALGAAVWVMYRVRARSRKAQSASGRSGS